MPVLFFSGGIDSTVLAYDLGVRPYAYGIDYEYEDLVLVTYGKSGAKRVKRLADSVSAVTRGNVVIHSFNNPLTSYDQAMVPAAGHATMVPSVGPYTWDRRSMPYTPGVMTWLASLAFNIVYDWELPTGRPQVFFGFQYELQAWAAHDRAEMPANDTSPQYIDALNNLSAAAGEPARFRAPFLENRMTRFQIVQLGLQLRAPLQDTHSCLMLTDTHCGRCCQCIKRDLAFGILGVK